jgi:cytoskeletal protein CcmA (bactofilin family)
VVGKSGHITGDVVCQNASIEGRIEGNVEVEELLFLKSTAYIKGDILTRKIVVEEGAEFNGNCRMNTAAKGLLTDREKNVERKAV